MDVDTYMQAHTKGGYHDEGPNGFGCIECALWREVHKWRDDFAELNAEAQSLNEELQEAKGLLDDVVEDYQRGYDDGVIDTNEKYARAEVGLD